MWVEPLLQQLQKMSWPAWLQPYVEVLLLWISWAIDYVDWDYMEVRSQLCYRTFPFYCPFFINHAFIAQVKKATTVKKEKYRHAGQAGGYSWFSHVDEYLCVLHVSSPFHSSPFSLIVLANKTSLMRQSCKTPLSSQFLKFSLRS